MEVTVGIADDHALFRNGLKTLVEGVEHFSVAFECDHADKVLELMAEHRPTILLLDINMPGEDTLEVAKKARAEFPDTHLLVISMYDESEIIFSFLDNGAIGYLTKDAEPEELILALHTVAKGDMYVSQSVSRSFYKDLAERRERDDGEEIQGIFFSHRELKIIRMICDELTSTEIAEKVYASKRTIESIRTKIMEKIGCTSKTGIVKFALANKIIRP